MTIKENFEGSKPDGANPPANSDADLTSRESNRAIRNMRSTSGADSGASGVPNNNEELEFTPLDLSGTAPRRNGFFEKMNRHNDAVSDTPSDAPSHTPDASGQHNSLNAMEGSHDQPQRRREHSVLVNGDRRFPVMGPQRELAKAELESNEKKWGSGNLSEQEKKAVHDIQNALLGGTFDAFTTAIQGLSNNPEKLSQALEEAQRNIQLAGGKVDLAFSDGKAYVYGENSKFAVQVDPETGNSAVKPITRADGAVTVGSGEVISKTPQAEFKAIGDDAVRGVAPLPIIEQKASSTGNINIYLPNRIPPPVHIQMDPIPRKYR